MTMNNANRNRWQLRAAAVVIFLLGAAAGALAPRAYHAWIGRSQQQRGQLDGIIKRLQLNAEQETRVRQILAETREEFRALRREREPREREIRERADERLRQVLTPEQLQTFQQLMSERRGPRRGRDDRGSPKN
jgi:Spy/CpxP family protein refolding chaperone